MIENGKSREGMREGVGGDGTHKGASRDGIVVRVRICRLSPAITIGAGLPEALRDACFRSLQ